MKTADSTNRHSADIQNAFQTPSERQLRKSLEEELYNNASPLSALAQINHPQTLRASRLAGPAIVSCQKVVARVEIPSIVTHGWINLSNTSLETYVALILIEKKNKEWVLGSTVIP